MNNKTVTALLEMRAITKSFPGVRALDGVTFDLLAGRFMRWSARTARASQR